MHLISWKNIVCIFLMASFIGFTPCGIHAQETIVLDGQLFPLKINKKSDLLLDDKSLFDTSNIIGQKGFERIKNVQEIFLKDLNNLWVRFKLKNETRAGDFFLGLQSSNIEEIWLYKVDSLNRLSLLQHTGNSLPFDTRKNDDVDFNFNLNIPSGKDITYYLKFKSRHPVEVQLVVSDVQSHNKSYLTQTIIIDFYSGIIITIILYNAFLFLFTKDRSYLIYVIYLLFLWLAQLSQSGWAFKYFWSSYPSLNKYAVIWTSALAGAFGVWFAKKFLHTSVFTPRLDKILMIIIGAYAVAIIAPLTGKLGIAYLILNISSMSGGLVLLLVAVIISRQKSRPAYFYLIAWSAFLSGIIIFVFRNFGIIATTNFTRSVLFIGSSIEAILLSIALADKINILQKEKTQSQAEALRVSRENEILVKEQNIVLEQKVNERTEELQHANHQLNDALTNLKDAQTQLVEAEKMASLGQLTAGIAHEINNPINFVKSNIKPLQLDFRDLEELIDEYNKLHTTDEKAIKSQLSNIASFQKQIDLSFVKTEIGSLIKGIEEGAERTAEIVRGLRTFSRLDEGELKTVNVHEGIDSTLVLLKNSFPYYIKIVKDFKADGNIDCYPGKLNQVFMNIINNGIQAIQAKPTKSDNETIVISTKDADNERIIISIKDSGTGMTDEVKQKIFEPFFTTKPVGEGTGLGMAIVFKIIEKHNGKIDILSSPDNGAEFILSLPHALSETSHNPR